MKITSATFVVSNSDVAKCPDRAIPEYAFIGRSNVGKSSLINMLANRKNLAKTSGTPGKTQLINHFLINDTWFLVDLPGYGYARTSKKTKKTFQKSITDYFNRRKQLVSAFVLLDARHEPQKIDLEFMQWLGTSGVPFGMIFTKSDKLKPKDLEENLAVYKNTMLEFWEELPPYFVTSSTKKLGKEAVLGYVGEVNRTVLGG